MKRPDVRAVLLANMFDGVDQVDFKMRISDLLDEAAERVDPLLEQAFEDGYQYRQREEYP